MPNCCFCWSASKGSSPRGRLRVCQTGPALPGRGSPPTPASSPPGSPRRRPGRSRGSPLVTVRHSPQPRSPKTPWQWGEADVGRPRNQRGESVPEGRTMRRLSCGGGRDGRTRKRAHRAPRGDRRRRVRRALRRVHSPPAGGARHSRGPAQLPSLPASPLSVATAGLSPGDIAQPIRNILRRSPNIVVVLAEATAVDIHARHVVLALVEQ